MLVKITSFVTILFLILIALVVIRDLSKVSLTLPVPQKEVKGVENQEIKLSPTVNITTLTAGYVQVMRVIDGDTIVVFVNGKNETIRLLGIDTPESDRRQVVECFGKEATSKIKELILNKVVRLEDDTTQSNQDRYQRLLRYVFLPDGTNVNLIMIREGFAHEYTYDNSYKYQREFREAEKQAREDKLGLWGRACIDD